MSKLKILFLCLIGLLYAEIGMGAEALLPIPQNYTDSLLDTYNAEEKALIQKDFANIHAMSLNRVSPVEKQKRPVYIATAGGPGAAKSTILENFIHAHPLKEGAVYVDPDRVSLKSMIYTYIPSLSPYHVAQNEDYLVTSEKAYHKWRGGSNYIANQILNDAVSKRMNLLHGTTSTSPAIERIYTRLKERDYEIILLLCGASDDTRIELLNHRKEREAFIQVTERDAREKGKLFPERFETYFKFADKVYLYWTENLNDQKTVLAAIYSSQKGLEIQNQKAFDQFVATHGALPI